MPTGTPRPARGPRCPVPPPDLRYTPTDPGTKLTRHHLGSAPLLIVAASDAEDGSGNRARIEDDLVGVEWDAGGEAALAVCAETVQICGVPRIRIAGPHPGEIAAPPANRDAAPATPSPDARIAVVIPCFRAASTVVDVIARIGPAVSLIYVVDDACPEGSGALVSRVVRDPRVMVLRNEQNRGVGGAMKRGYAQALDDRADIIVKVDADGQMDPAFIPLLVAPLLSGAADYAKGNRFAPRHLTPRDPNPVVSRPMPLVRRVGNNAVSFLHKAITGYWGIVDPANGYTAVHRRVLECVDLHSVAECFYFETDMLFHLNLVDAAVVDVALPARYLDEVSNLRVRSVAARFPRYAVGRFLKRIGIQYFVRDFNVASVELLVGMALVLMGAGFGGFQLVNARVSGVPATAGTVMLAALPIMLGFQLLLAALSYDVFRSPRLPHVRRGEG